MTVNITEHRLQILRALPDSTQPAICLTKIPNSRLTKAQKELHLQALQSVGLIAPMPTCSRIFGTFSSIPDVGEFLNTPWCRTPAGDLLIQGRREAWNTLSPLERLVFQYVPVYSHVKYGWTSFSAINSQLEKKIRAEIRNFLRNQKDAGALHQVGTRVVASDTIDACSLPIWSLDPPAPDAQWCFGLPMANVDWSTPATLPEWTQLLEVSVPFYDAFTSLIRKGFIAERATYGGGLGQTIRLYTESYVGGSFF